MEVDYVASRVTVEHRRAIRAWARSVSPCAMLSDKTVTTIKVPNPDSASDSIMLLMDLLVSSTTTIPNVIVKMTFMPRDHTEQQVRDHQLRVEAAIYEFLASTDLPFVIQWIATMHCNNSEGMLQSLSGRADVMRKLQTRLQQMHHNMGSKYDVTRSQLLVLERGTGRKLEAYASKDANNWWAIVLQTLFALAYFEDVGVMHHDLHSGNVWVDDTEPTTYVLQVSKKQTITFTARVMAKLYDFDHGSKSGTRYAPSKLHNRLLEGLCNFDGECNTFAPGRDFAQFAWWVTRLSNAPAVVKEWIATVVSPDFLRSDNSTLSWQGQPCIKSASQCRKLHFQSLKTILATLGASPLTVQPSAPTVYVALPSA